MKRPSNRFFIAAGLTSMLAGILFAAIYLGIIPDRLEAERKGRAAWVEALAASTALMANGGDLARASALLTFIAERQPSVRSIGLRATGGQLLQVSGEHDRLWQDEAAKGVDIGRHRPEPGNEVLVVRGIAHLSPYFPSSSFNALSRRSQTVLNTFTRAKFLSLASTRVQGAKPVEVRSTMSQTAET